jgi:hypothetical protein
VNCTGIDRWAHAAAAPANTICRFAVDFWIGLDTALEARRIRRSDR